MASRSSVSPALRAPLTPASTHALPSRRSRARLAPQVGDGYPGFGEHPPQQRQGEADDRARVAVDAVHERRAAVRFGTPSDSELAAYIASGEPMAMAGAFSIEGLGAPFVDSIDGDPGTVLGLSLPLLRRMLAEAGVAITDLWRKPGARST